MGARQRRIRGWWFLSHLRSQPPKPHPPLGRRQQQSPRRERSSVSLTIPRESPSREGDPSPRLARTRLRRRRGGTRGGPHSLANALHRPVPPIAGLPSLLPFRLPFPCRVRRCSGWPWPSRPPSKRSSASVSSSSSRSWSSLQNPPPPDPGPPPEREKVRGKGKEGVEVDKWVH